MVIQIPAPGIQLSHNSHHYAAFRTFLSWRRHHLNLMEIDGNVNVSSLVIHMHKSKNLLFAGLTMAWASPARASYLPRSWSWCDWIGWFKLAARPIPLSPSYKRSKVVSEGEAIINPASSRSKIYNWAQRGMDMFRTSIIGVLDWSLVLSYRLCTMWHWRLMIVPWWILEWVWVVRVILFVTPVSEAWLNGLDRVVLVCVK